MTARRIFRIFLALIVLGIFGVYCYFHAYVSPKTEDIGPPGQTYDYQAWSQPSPPLDGLLGSRFAPEGTIRPVSPRPQQPESSAPAQELPAQPQENEPAEPAEPTPEPTPEPTLDPNSPAAKAAALGLPAPPEIDVTSWEFTLVNGDHSIGSYEPETIAYLNQTLSETDIQYGYNPNRCPVDARIAEALIAFGQGCKDAGLPVFLSSGYRGYAAQAENFRRICQNNGITDGKDANGHYITMPAGCSEHQLATCCDITDRYYEIKNDSIEKTDTFQWLVAHCAEYGFIHRFPSGKEDITGVMYEPWHFRYVGVEAARYMTDNSLVLEEFLALYGVE